MDTLPFLPVARASAPNGHVDDTYAIERLFDGKYRVERVIGRGGVGVVLAATHVGLGQRVAIKLLSREGRDDPEARARFDREARAMASIANDHVVRVHDVGVLDTDVPYIVMELLEGDDLATVLASHGALGVDRALDFALQICEAIAAAHAKGIVHRDLKPANVFVARRADSASVLKVVDFGLSKPVRASGRDKITGDDRTMGTPGWMSPEQLRSARDVDARTDVWSLGAIFYQMLTGVVPFAAMSFGPFFASPFIAEPAPPSRIAQEVPAGLDAAVLGCLQRDPDDRFQDVAAFARALAPFATAAAVARIEAIERLAGRERGQRRRRRRRSAAWAAIPGAMIVGAVAAALVPAPAVSENARASIALNAAPPQQSAAIVETAAPPPAVLPSASAATRAPARAHPPVGTASQPADEFGGRK